MGDPVERLRGQVVHRPKEQVGVESERDMWAVGLLLHVCVGA